MRFFEKDQNDIHNLGMATDRHQAPSYPLRMPDALKVKVQEAAEASGRSLHAELLHRLTTSFSQPMEDFRRGIESQVSAIQNRIEMQNLRIDLLKTRAEGLVMKCAVIAEQADAMTKAAKTDADFAAAKVKISELRQLENESQLMQKQMDEILVDRNQCISQLGALMAVLAEARKKMEKGMADYIARRDVE